MFGGTPSSPQLVKRRRVTQPRSHWEFLEELFKQVAKKETPFSTSLQALEQQVLLLLN
jgi:hypothetical protein